MTHLTACPVGIYERPEMEKEDLDNLASKALKRRTHLSWESFQQFSNDVNMVCFVETVEKDGEINYECSCAIGLKGILN